MGPTTHGTAIVGNGFVAFIDGTPDQCQHDSDGPTLSFNQAGDYFNDCDIPDYNDDRDGWYAFHDKHNLTGGCASCSKCGKPVSPPMFD